MSAATSRLTRWPRDGAAQAGILLVALVVGVVAGRSPMLGIALAAALVYGLIVTWNLALGVCLFLLVTFLDVVSNNQNLSLTKAAGAVLAASWLATVATRRGSRPSLTAVAPWLVVAMIAFLAWSGISAVWAESPSAAVRSTIRFGLDAMLVPIAFWAIRDRKQVVWLFGVFVVGALLSVMWGLTHGKVAGGAAAAQVGRLSGANVEANELATLLIVCTILAGALALARTLTPAARTLSLLAGIAATVALFATFSRSGIVAFVVVILAGCIYGGRWRPAFIVLAIGVALVGAVFLQDTSSGAVQRLSSTSTTGRSDIWKVGLRMVRANPVAGVGSGNYTITEQHYVLTSPGAIQHVDFIISKPYVAHNIYLHITAEMGVVGLALFLSVILFSIHAALKAVTLFRAAGDRSLEILARALVLGLVGILTADFFASDQYSKQLWLLLAVGPALLAIARRSQAGDGQRWPKLTPPERLLASDAAPLQ